MEARIVPRKNFFSKNVKYFLNLKEFVNCLIMEDFLRFPLFMLIFIVL